ADDDESDEHETPAARPARKATAARRR
ncbi:ribosome silencing factor, partial [Burkholderia pseudomallei]|nr:ribosome silencing factor [Burkholderia pseudomallei]